MQKTASFTVQKTEDFTEGPHTEDAIQCMIDTPFRTASSQQSLSAIFKENVDRNRWREDNCSNRGMKIKSEKIIFIFNPTKSTELPVSGWESTTRNTVTSQWEHSKIQNSFTGLYRLSYVNFSYLIWSLISDHIEVFVLGGTKRWY